MTQPNQSEQYVTSENNYVTPTSGKSEKLCNQSELEQWASKFIESVHTGHYDYDEYFDVQTKDLCHYITAHYTANSEVAERERAARIDEIRRTRPHLTYPGMVYYGERMNELRSNETEEI